MPQPAATRPRRSRSATASTKVKRQEIKLHGHRIVYRSGGSGPVILFVHGITSNSGTWEKVLGRLSKSFTVIAPDLPGHGESDPPAGDYSMGAYASVLRDLLLVLGHEHATLVGHSLGGGIVMQMSYQYPELAERLVLVSSGGLGREVNGLLRAATLPFSEYVIPVISAKWLLDRGATIGRLIERLGFQLGTDIREIARGHSSLARRDARLAFIHTLRASVDPTGQRADARDRLYLAETVPTLIAWGERDFIIPVDHGRTAHAQIPGSRLELLPGAGHFAHVQDPDWFIDVLEDFIATTEPHAVDLERLRALLQTR